MHEPTRLQLALAEACELARTYGAEITPADFALQRSEPGYQHATYVSPDIVVSVSIAPDGTIEAGAIVEPDWFELDDQGDDAGEFFPQYRGRPVTDIPLPGDGEPPAAPELPPYACRDGRGAIRRARDGLFIADAGTTADDLRARLTKYADSTTAYANAMRTLYLGALELVETEGAEAVSVGA